jgi:hypothetical protein
MLAFLITIVNAVVSDGEYHMSLESLEARLATTMAGMSLSVSYPSPTAIAAVQPPMSLEVAKAKVKSLPQSVTDALTMPVTHRHHKRHGSHVPNPELLQHERQMQRKGIEEALDKAKETLSEMMEETETEMDAAIFECKEVDVQTTAMLDENSGYRATIAGEIAATKGDIAEDKAAISDARAELDSIKDAATASANECATAIKAHQDGLAILEADLQVSMQVENMTDCDDVTPGSATTLLQCGTGWLSRFKFAGRAAQYDGLLQMKSKEGSLAVQRAAKAILNLEFGVDAYKNDFVPTKRITRHGLVRHVRLPVHTKHGLVQTKRAADETTPPPEEVNRSSPLSAEGAEALVNMTLLTSPEPVSYNPDDLMEKCTVSGSPSCPMLRDALAQLSSEVRWARDQAAVALQDLETECKRLEEDYATQNTEWEGSLEQSNVKLVESTAKLNTGEENLRQRVMEANDLLQTLAEHRKECAKKINEGAETICGIKSIRQELYQMQSFNPFIQDCEVGEWQPGECSVECAGGELTITREIVTPASNGGAACPIMQAKEACNLQPCPIACVVGDWSGFSVCSKDCGGGIQVRSRSVQVEPEHGGEPCGDLQEQQECNVEACDRPCELDPLWSEWSECSKECDYGYIVRYKQVAREAGPAGECPGPFDDARMQAAYCNIQECPQDLICSAQMDTLILLDGSGSVNWYGPGFEQERAFTLNLFELLSIGEEGTKAGVILFSWEAELVSPLTTDKAALVDAVQGMVWPHWTTDTAAALTMAQTELTNSGRPEIPKERTIVFLITDGNANSVSAANAAAEAVKEVATLFVVVVGSSINLNVVKKWATWPEEEHLIQVDEFELLESKITELLADVCSKMGCKETMTGNGQDYIGCQYQTNSGRMCQSWTEQTPQSHGYIPDWFPDAHLGDHNFCRNPDGDSTIWCLTTDPTLRWDFCAPRSSSEVPDFLMEEPVGTSLQLRDDFSTSER